ncbi:MAG: DUF998 domain-containing protein [Maribacter sp.]|uniref:DUF998 domain-containing protein n=1 Tax=Maribacter sp. TaxID=1897614 RepID=UPI003298E1B0
MNRSLVFALGVLGALLFVISSILGGLWIDGYSFVGQYISESFATGVSNAEYLRFMYIASGILLFVFSLLTPNFFPKSKGGQIGFLVFGILYGLGNVTVALFPCDEGCPMGMEDSSFAQIVHNTSAFFTYLIIPFCLMGIGFSLRSTLKGESFPMISIICGAIAFAFVVLLFGNPTGSFIGLFQRIIEGSILFWVIYTSFYIRRTNNN